MAEMRRRMEEELKLRGFSPRTNKTYLCWVRRFTKHHRRPPEQMGSEEVRAFLVDLLEVQKLSRQSMVQAYCALKFFYVDVLHQKFEIDLRFPKRKRTLPRVLSELEVRRLLNAAEDLKEWAIVMTLYSAGLRLNELIHLKVTDIDSNKMLIRVRQGKGAKDRNVVLSRTLLSVLRRYFLQYRPETWLFYGRTPETLIYDQTVERMVRRLSEKAGLRGRVTPHTLRHSFATHLLERGTEVVYIQELLGHKSIKTTMVYTRISPKALSKVVSPLDSLDWRSPI